MSFEPISTPDQATALIDWGRGLIDGGNGVFWGLWDKPSMGLIGSLNLNRVRDADGSTHRTEIGYDLAREYWGRGLVPEAIRATLPYAFGPLGASRVEATVHVQNYRSARVLVKCGFQIEGILRQYARMHGQLVDMIAFSLLKRDWEARVGDASEASAEGGRAP